MQPFAHYFYHSLTHLHLHHPHTYSHASILTHIRIFKLIFLSLFLFIALFHSYTQELPLSVLSSPLLCSSCSSLSWICSSSLFLHLFLSLISLAISLFLFLSVSLCLVLSLSFILSLLFSLSLLLSCSLSFSGFSSILHTLTTCHSYFTVLYLKDSVVDQNYPQSLIIVKVCPLPLTIQTLIKKIHC